jgi:hypothetical protein
MGDDKVDGSSNMKVIVNVDLQDYWLMGNTGRAMLATTSPRVPRIYVHIYTYTLHVSVAP